MNKLRPRPLTAASLAIAALVAGTALALPGGKTPPAPVSPIAERTDDLRNALVRALDDERAAIALYEAVIAKHGERRPFSRIVHAERRHAGSLLAQFERLGLEPPETNAAGRIPEVPASFRDACDEAEFAEIRNIRLYDELLETVQDEQVRAVFRQLRAASADRHLRAFRRHGSGWRVLADEPTITQQAQIEKAIAARNALFGSLLAKLSDEIATSGPESAISVCKDEAPRIARRVGAEHGVRIGRTSLKLRNPANTGAGWTTLALGDRPEEPRVLADRSGRLGFVSPIRVAGACTACHGTADVIAPEVHSRLRALYPEDRATGYREGDLRGWFWIEVPAG